MESMVALPAPANVTPMITRPTVSSNHDGRIVRAPWDQLLEREARQRQEACWQSFENSIGRRLANATLDNYATKHPGQAEARESVRRYARRLASEVDAGNGMILYGPCGTGKDHLLIGLAKVAIRQRIPVAWAYGPDLWSELRDRIGTDKPEDAWVRHLTAPRILILSDLALANDGLTPYQAGMLARILDRRYREQRPTWASLNVSSGAEADRLLGASLVDRLRDGALTLHCNWPSYRRAKPMEYRGSDNG